MSIFKRACLGRVTTVATAAALVAPLSAQQQQKPNILVIVGDDIATGASAPTIAA
jgi:arylsulfatase